MAFQLQQCMNEGKARQCKIPAFREICICRRDGNDRCGHRVGKEFCARSPLFRSNQPIAEPVMVAAGKPVVNEQKAVGL